MRTPPPAANSQQERGQAMVEFLIIIPVLILLIFGAFQATLIYSAKSGLNYAAFQAARLGAVNNAQYEGMRRGLLRGMYPMFSQYPEATRMEKTAEEVDNFVLITRISPALSSVSKFNQRQSGGSFSENSRQSWDQYAAICGQRKAFVLTSEATVRMQSAAVHDTEKCGAGKKMLCP